MHIRVFPEVDHFANIARIVLADHTIGSTVVSNFFKRFATDLAKISQGFGKITLNRW